MNILKILKENISTICVKYFNEDNKMDEMQIFYVAGSQTLPPPLSSNEEEEILKRIENNDLEAKKILVEHNLRLVVYIAKKFENTGIGIEDLV